VIKLWKYWLSLNLEQELNKNGGISLMHFFLGCSMFTRACSKGLLIYKIIKKRGKGKTHDCIVVQSWILRTTWVEKLRLCTGNHWVFFQKKNIGFVVFSKSSKYLLKILRFWLKEALLLLLPFILSLLPTTVKRIGFLSFLPLSPTWISHLPFNWRKPQSCHCSVTTLLSFAISPSLPLV
jgi:hypothetical protein